MCSNERMSITPLFSAAELDSQIAAYKVALTACASGQSYRISSGGTDRMLTRSDLPEIRKTLEWLQVERVKVEVGPGLQCLPGRPRR